MMRKWALLAGAVAVMAFGRPALAQGPFADVPTDHWAYDAVNELAQRGIVNGYPDSTFGGKRALTRYEFAVAIQRMLQDGWTIGISNQSDGVRRSSVGNDSVREI